MDIRRDLDWLNSALEKVEKSSETRKVFYVPMPKEDGEKVIIKLFPPNKDTLCIQSQHWGLLEKPVTCLHTFGKECPICKEIDRSIKKVDLLDIPYSQKSEIIKRLYSKKAKERNLIFAFMVKGDNLITDRVYMFTLTRKFYALATSVKEESGIDVFNPSENCGQVIIKRKGKDITYLIVPAKPYIAEVQKVAGWLTRIVDYVPEPSQEIVDSAVEMLSEKVEYYIAKATGVSPSTKSEEQNNEEAEQPKTCFLKKKGEIVEMTISEKRKYLRDEYGINIEDDNKVACFGEHGSKEECKDCEWEVACSHYAEEVKDSASEEDIEF